MLNTKTAIILEQTQNAYQWVDKLVASIDPSLWDKIPANLETNLSWQVGHLSLSFNYHSIMVIAGHQTDLYQQFPIQQYAKLFFSRTAEACVGVYSPADLLKHLKAVQNKSIEIISNLNDTLQDQPLEPTDFPHPIAKTKYEALDWNVKHTMWHCGQIAMLKRCLGEGYDFGKAS